MDRGQRRPIEASDAADDDAGGGWRGEDEGRKQPKAQQPSRRLLLVSRISSSRCIARGAAQGGSGVTDLRPQSSTHPSFR